MSPFLVPLLTVFLGAPAGTDTVTSCRGGVDAGRTASAAWLELPDPDSSVTVARTGLTLQVASSHETPTTAVVHARLAGGGTGTWVTLDSFTLGPQEVAQVRVLPETLGVDLGSLSYSAQLEVMVRLVDAAGGKVDTAWAPGVFMHRGNRSVRAYGSRAVFTRHNGGDFQRLHGRQDGHTLVVDAGSGVGDLDGVPDEDGFPAAAGRELCPQYHFTFVDSGLGEDFYADEGQSAYMRASGIEYEVSGPGIAGTLSGHADEYGCITELPQLAGNYSLTIRAKADLGVDNGDELWGYQSEAGIHAWDLQLAADADQDRIFVEIPNLAITNLMAASTQTINAIGLHPVGIIYVRAYQYVADGIGNVCDEACSVNSSIYFAFEEVTQEKFGVSHEVGHQQQKSLMGKVSTLPNIYSDTYNQDILGCEFTEDDGPGGHALRSLEVSSAAFNEGFGHFMASLAWNEPDEDGWFVYYKQLTGPSYFTWTMTALEGDAIIGNPGGTVNWRLNQCAFWEPNLPDGYETEIDWLRMLWDVRTSPATPDNGNGPPVTAELLWAFLEYVWDTNDFGWNFDASEILYDTAVSGQWPNAPADFAERWAHYADLNGTDPWE